MNVPMSDVETQWRLTDHSDLGIRIPGARAIVLNHKVRYRGVAHSDSAGFATVIGGGVVNWAQHAYVEGALAWSNACQGSTARYGGLKVMLTLPIRSGAVRDTPTLGGFVGPGIGNAETAISQELGIYPDRSALRIHSGSLVSVPAEMVRGISFLPRIFGLF